MTFVTKSETRNAARGWLEDLDWRVPHGPVITPDTPGATIKLWSDRRYSTVSWREHLAVDPDFCQGKACIAGARVMVTVILDDLATGLTDEEVAESNPSVSADAVKAALQYAAELAKERMIPLGAQRESMRFKLLA